jgi:dipeptidyl aminopeptidase/acylaminoacyl peptidase
VPSSLTTPRRARRTARQPGSRHAARDRREAGATYDAMSPFRFADKIDEPILLIHGTADNNTGTFPIQTERLFAALQGLGGRARYVQLPAESHGYRARETALHVLWEQVRWLDTHVKKAAPRPTPR